MNEKEVSLCCTRLFTNTVYIPERRLANGTLEAALVVDLFIDRQALHSVNGFAALGALWTLVSHYMAMRSLTVFPYYKNKNRTLYEYH